MVKDIFAEFVSVCFDNSQAAAARELGVDRSTVCRVLNGERGVSPALALRIEQVSGGRYAKERFIWPESEAA